GPKGGAGRGAWSPFAGGSRPAATPSRWSRVRTATRETWYDLPDWITSSPRSDLPRSVLRNEVIIVFLLSLGASAVYAVVNLLADLTAPGGLAKATATLNASHAPERPDLDLTHQRLATFFALVPGAPASHLLRRGRARPMQLLGIDARQPRRDLGVGVTLALVIGVPGILLYLGARSLGISVNVVAEGLPHIWWAIPVLVLSA